MKKIIASLIVLSSVNAFATVEWGNLKCNELSINDIQLMSKLMSNVKQNELKMVREEVASKLAKRTNKKDKIQQLELDSDVLELENVVIDHEISFLEFTTKCIDEKIGG